jgi:tetratricopeptide (TPR) repeat protein
MRLIHHLLQSLSLALFAALAFPSCTSVDTPPPLAPDKAARVAELTPQCTPANPKACLEVAKIYEDNNDWTRALATYKKGFDLNAKKLSKDSLQCLVEAKDLAYDDYSEINNARVYLEAMRRYGYYKPGGGSWQSYEADKAHMEEMIGYTVESADRQANSGSQLLAVTAGALSQAAGGIAADQAYWNNAYQSAAVASVADVPDLSGLARAMNSNSTSTTSTGGARGPAVESGGATGSGMRAQYLAAAAQYEKAAAKLPADETAQRNSYLEQAREMRRLAADLNSN